MAGTIRTWAEASSGSDIPGDDSMVAVATSFPVVPNAFSGIETRKAPSPAGATGQPSGGDNV